MDMHSTLKMNNGTRIPRIGFGVFRLESGTQTVQAVLDALEAGYRHIDTAAIYGNEAEVAQAIAQSGIPRNELFITGKMWKQDLQSHTQEDALKKSLETLRTDYLDLYLIHWPVDGCNIETFEKMLKMEADGACKAIGVSNFHCAHLEELASAGLKAPATNQIELHPLWSRGAEVSYCRQHDIIVEAYSPFGGTGARVLAHPVIIEIAQKYNKSPAQVVVRWDLQHDIVVFPKSTSPARMRENADVFDFELSEADMALLDGVNSDTRFGFDQYQDK